MTSFRRALPEGHRILGCRIDRVVTASATAVVYAATDLELASRVAIKEYMPVQLARREDDGSVWPVDASAFARGLNAFVASARTLARCEQAGLVSVLQVGQANGTAYQVMPWLEGTSLAALRAAMAGPPDEPALRSLLGSLLNAIEAFHATGQVHGGIEPAKILLQADDSPVLLGPGRAARGWSVGAAADLATASPAPAFAAPEQVADGNGDKPGPWTDLYSLAAVAWFCITGSAPKRAARAAAGLPHDALAGVVATRFGGLPAARYSAALLAVIDRSLASRVSERPQSVADFRAALAPPLQAPAAAAPQALAEPPPADDLPPMFADDGEPVLGFEQEPVLTLDQEPDIEVERARLKRLVNSIDFGADDAPRTSVPTPSGRGMPRPKPPPAAAAPSTAPRSPTPMASGSPARRPEPRAPSPEQPKGARFSVSNALVLVVIAVLGAIAMWAIVRPPAPGDAPSVATAPVASPELKPADTAVLPASAPALISVPVPVPVPLAEAPAASGADAASVAGSSALVAATYSASAPAIASSATAFASEAASAPTAAPTSANASAPPAVLTPPAKRAALPARTTELNPRQACTGRSDFSLYRCMKTQCGLSRWSAHPQCVLFRATDRVPG